MPQAVRHLVSDKAEASPLAQLYTGCGTCDELKTAGNIALAQVRRRWGGLLVCRRRASGVLCLANGSVRWHEACVGTGALSQLLTACALHMCLGAQRKAAEQVVEQLSSRLKKLKKQQEAGGDGPEALGLEGEVAQVQQELEAARRE